jgi:hypothetical protein
MTPTHAVKKGTRYHYYVSRPLITRHRTERSTGLRIPAAGIERLVTNRVRHWLLNPPIRLRRAGRVITMRIDGTDPFATAQPDARLIKPLIRAHRFNTTLVDGGSVPFAALAERDGVSSSYFTRLVRLSYLAPDITQAILDGRQPRDLNIRFAQRQDAGISFDPSPAPRYWNLAQQRH